VRCYNNQCIWQPPFKHDLLENLERAGLGGRDGRDANHDRQLCKHPRRSSQRFLILIFKDRFGSVTVTENQVLAIPKTRLTPLPLVLLLPPDPYQQPYLGLVLPSTFQILLKSFLSLAKVLPMPVRVLPVSPTRQIPGARGTLMIHWKPPNFTVLCRHPRSISSDRRRCSIRHDVQQQLPLRLL